MNSIATIQNLEPESFHVVRHGSVVANAIHSRAFLFGEIGMRFKRRNLPLCECGCGYEVKWCQTRKQWNPFINGHQNRGKNNSQYSKTGKLSAVYGKDKYAEEKAKSKPLCKCGCKNKTKWCKSRKKFNEYINGHYICINNPMNNPKSVAKLTGKNSCNYGKTGKNHPAYGSQKSEAKRKKTSKTLIGNQNSKGTRRNKEFCENQRKIMLNGGAKHANSFKTPESYKAHTEYMLNGGAAYLNSLIKSPSKPQVELFELIKQLFPNAILNHPSLNRSIDIAIPDKMIAIEYDGSYWHQDQKADDKRQKELESLGCKFLRYCDYVPTIDELERDLKGAER